MHLIPYLLVTATVTSVPVIVVAMVARNWLGPRPDSGLIALSFAGKRGACGPDPPTSSPEAGTLALFILGGAV